MIKITKFILILLILVCPAVASDINIYYPDNNTTTSIYYSIDDYYNHTIANNISGDFSSIILKEEIEYDNIIESPHKVVKPLFGLILIIVLLCIAWLLIIALKRIFR